MSVSGGPLVTVTIPMYNNERFIRQTVESVLSQTYTNFELLVYDDCSTDGSYEIVASIDDPRIRLLRNPGNLGPEGNWNRAVSNIRGTYVKLICGDDILFPDCLEKQVAVFEEMGDERISLVCAQRTIIDADSNPLIKKINLVEGGRHQAVDVTRKLIRMGTNILGEPVCGLYPASLLPRTRGYSATVPYTIDLDFWMQLLKLGDLYMIEEPLCAFRISDESWSSRIGDLRYHQFLEFMEQTASDGSFEITDLDMFIGKINCAVHSMTSTVGFKLFA
ncbi:glycosyltransferase family 2 protein [Prosthecochloris sp. N3]|uniref:Glycosyltransferase family 2 protein n=1 Tax=Prosthecochloris ethylica TaxID=2743976 RepID=A0ABR9XPW0_9CHLB|nr:MULTISPECIES: glycosyltransferase family 2 protein [Prosthecochloris]MEC9486308.1 glycosyltransferase family 2 protein [Prosthecochloris sp.]MBF0586167.1 glycosyltransferase family 2 protein [Prosthecochloris ethylica]MBF0635873.1 glycosyltransferase family 2 protein [Prosthecochloris ethylica]NUK47452.1 glycosyltransferase family 2 protein [Prosthecochloris ethylica]RNA65000.1 glycosyltransferase family 2 protein [Prosthecochloris sp. ZM_2]